MMRKKQLPLLKTAADSPPEKAATTLKDYILSFPPGTKLSEIFIDTQDLSVQLKYSKRTIDNMRKAGKISHTCLEQNGKAFYFQQELTDLMIENAVIGKNSPLRKRGIIKSVTNFAGLFSLLSFDLEALAGFVCLA